MTLSRTYRSSGCWPSARSFALFSVSVAPFVGPRRYNRAKLDAYECGIEPTPQPIGGGRFPVKFYLTAMLFIIFDIETIFLYPWAVSFEALGPVRVRGDGPVHRHRLHRLRLRVAARRPELGLIDHGYRRETPERHPAHLGREAVNWARKSSLLGRHVRPRLLRHRDDGRRRPALRPGPLGHGGLPGLAPPGRPDDRRRPGEPEDGPGAAPDLRPDARAALGALDGRLRLVAAACSTTTRSCRASTTSCRSTCTCRAARRGRRC